MVAPGKRQRNRGIAGRPKNLRALNGRKVGALARSLVPKL